MADLRELFDNPEEAFRSMWAGIQKHLHTSLVSHVTEDSDGKTLKAQPTTKQTIQDPTLNQTTYPDFPLLLDVPLHFVGGGGTTITHAVKTGDEILTVFAGRPIDNWFQQGGTAQQIFNRMHSLSDGIAIPGVRSTPRELKQISTEAMHTRSDDKLHVVEVHPSNGISHVSADPSTPPASDSFDPFTMASRFISHIVQGAKGVIGSAVDGGTTHSHGVFHGVGAWMSALNGLHQVLAHPDRGALLSALGGAHTVTASPSGVMLESTASIALQCPAGGLSLPSGGVSSGSLAPGAASTNVGGLSGDLAGTLPSPQVVGLSHVDGRSLPLATSDGAAASAGVPVGGLYRDTSIASGKTVIVMRAA